VKHCVNMRTAYSNVATLPADEKPVKKVPLAVSGNEREVYLDELDDGGVPDNAGRSFANERDQILTLHSRRVGRLRCKIVGLKETLSEESI
jgi:hypothetical protein